MMHDEGKVVASTLTINATSSLISIPSLNQPKCRLHSGQNAATGTKSSSMSEMYSKEARARVRARDRSDTDQFIKLAAEKVFVHCVISRLPEKIND